MTVEAQRALHVGLTILTYEESRPGFLETNRKMFEECRDTLKAMTT